MALSVVVISAICCLLLVVIMTACYYCCGCHQQANTATTRAAQRPVLTYTIATAAPGSYVHNRDGSLATAVPVADTVARPDDYGSYVTSSPHGSQRDIPTAVEVTTL